MSNKLSVRRAVVRHPKICAASPSCPPPPPPIEWPPTLFDLEFRYTCIPMMGPCSGGADLVMERQIEEWDWQDAGPPPEGVAARWLVDDNAHTATLTITGNNEQWMGYWLEKFNIPVIWNTPTLYVINTWDVIDWFITSAEAKFTF